jgi:hypothetical protein
MPPRTPSPPPWIQKSVGVYQLDHFCVFLPKGSISIRDASMSAESVNLENRCNLTCCGASEQVSVAPYSPRGGSGTLGGGLLMIISWFLLVEVL